MPRPPLFPAMAVLVALAAPAQAPALSADQVIAKHLEARGGLARLRAIQSLRITSRLGVAELPSVGEWKRPMAYRQTVKVQGMDWIRAFDGKSGWTINPFSGYGGFKEPQPLNPEQLRAIELTADLDGPLVDWQAKGHKVAYLGTEDVDGGLAHKLKVTLKNGDQVTYFLDADSWMSIKEITRRVVRGTEEESETVLGNYEATGGVYFPRLIQEGEKGSDEKQAVTIEKVEINPDLSMDRFTMPAKQAK
jgi:hypothetical protein